MTSGGPVILVALPAADRELYFDSATWTQLERLGRLVASTPDSFRSNMHDATVLISNSALPPITADVVRHAPKLRLLAHTGSTVKRIMAPEAWRSGIRVVLGGSAIAEAVAETAVGYTLALLHRTNRSDHALRHGTAWQEARSMPLRRMAAGARVGVVGASRVGRAYIRRMQALGADVAVTDPYLDADAAKGLNVRLANLDDLLRDSLVVSLHAPVNESTVGMLGTRELALLSDGSILVNTARAALIDGAALLSELRTGRMDAALDVYDDEPLPVDSDLRSLPNVLLTPHVAGNTLESRRAAGRMTVEQVARFLRGEPLTQEVTAEMLANMA